MASIEWDIAQDMERCLTLIAEGYYKECLDDRFILLDNPDYRPDNGSDPNLLFDTYEWRLK